MTEEFKVKFDEAIFVQAEPLKAIVSAVFEKLNISSKDAQIGADALISADLRGVDSHGVSNMLRIYVQDYKNGTLNPQPKLRIVREAPATASIDADGGLGIIVVPEAMEIAVQKAKEVGVGMVTIANSGHLGMASYHSLIAAKHDMIGTCMTSGPARVLPTFGAEVRLSTNPIAVAAPANKEPPFVFDAATSVIAANKIGLAKRLGAKLSAGLLGDLNGTPIMEPSDPPQSRDLYKLLPLGSTREGGSHKGYGLACVVDILSGILGGTRFSGLPGFGHFVAAYNIEAFTDIDSFKSLMDQFLRSLRTTPPAPGHDRVLYPGLLEWETQNKRNSEGIPFHPEVIEWFKNICNEMSIPFDL